MQTLTADAYAKPQVQAACFHCGLPVPASSSWSVRIDNVERAMCCPGCEAVARGIVDNGLGDYYRTRDGYGATADKDGLVPPELKLYDTPDALDEFAVKTDGGMREASFSVEGIRCAACVWLIEQRLARVPGLQSVSLNVATERLHASWADGQCKPSDILGALRALG